MGSDEYAAFSENMNAVVLNQGMKGYNSVPGGRVFFKLFSASFRNIDRLNFYYLHNTNFTSYNRNFLEYIFQLSQDKGNLIGFLQDTFDLSLIDYVYETESYLENALDYKANYTDRRVLEKNSNGLGFFSNNLDLYTIQIPFVLCLHLTFLVVFRVTINFKLSSVFRKYCFKLMFLFMLFEGSIENLTFYFFGETQNFFSRNFRHKLLNLQLVFTFFVIMLYVFGALLWLRYHYQKNVRYFLKEYKVCLTSLFL